MALEAIAATSNDFHAAEVGSLGRGGQLVLRLKLETQGVGTLAAHRALHERR